MGKTYRCNKCNAYYTYETTKINSEKYSESKNETRMVTLHWAPKYTYDTCDDCIKDEARLKSSYRQ